MNKAVFLDRDGVINHPKKHYYVYRVEDFILNKGVIEALKLFQNNNYMLIVITNQGGISKGVYTKDDVDILHTYMENELAAHDIYISDILYCPHHSKLENCLCRKPKHLMLQKAMAQFDIDPEQSWFIGDKQSDVDAGIAAGVNTIKIRKNQNLMKFIGRII